MATQEQKTSIQEQKNAIKESMNNHKNALKESLKEQQQAMEKTYYESKEAAKDGASGLMALLQRMVDRVVTPEQREQAYERIGQFAKERPMLASFIACQVLTSSVPIGVFAAFTSSVATLSLGAAMMFSLFWFGVAVMVLIPTLFVTVSLGSIMFFWGVMVQLVWNVLPMAIKNFFSQTREEADNSYSAAVTRAKKAIKDSANRNGLGTNGTYANGDKNGYNHD